MGIKSLEKEAYKVPPRGRAELVYSGDSEVCLLVVFVYADEGSEVESEMDEDLDDSSEPQAKREKTELSQAFQVGCMQPVLESGVQPSLLSPIHSEHIVTSTQTIRQCSATGNTYTAV